MRYSIHQLNATTWELRAHDGTVIGTFEDSSRGQTGYDLALGALGERIRADQLAAQAMAPMEGADMMAADGLLPERWTSDQGIAFSEALAGGRDFSDCMWTWRDPTASLVPLMLQTETEMGHYGAELAGFIEEIAENGGTVTAAGRFYATDVGTQARDLLLDGRRFGVSVDPTEAVEMEEDFTCVEFDDEGFCEAGDWALIFHAYEIGGLTMTPFPGFENASIVLETADAAASTAPPAKVAASALSIPAEPPAAWMRLAEPAPGEVFLDGEMGEDVLVEQTDRHGNVLGMACPITIRDDGLVYGHLTFWGQCHTGEPWGAGVCASAAPSATGYRDFHAGTTVCDDGTSVATGQLVVGCEHSSAFDVAGVRDHLAHAGMGWASVHVVDGQFGPWLCGVLRPDLTEQQVATLRALSLSGEWVGELGGILAVNASGLPVQRERLAASALATFGWKIAPVALRASRRNGEVTKLVGGNIVGRCPECAQRRAQAAAGARDGGSEPRLARIETMLTTLERRTRHLIPAEAAAVRASVAIPGPSHLAQRVKAVVSAESTYGNH